MACVHNVHLSKTKASSVDTKTGGNGDSLATLGSLFQYLMTLTFKNKIFLLLQVLMVNFALLCFARCKNSLSSPWKFPSVNILVWNSQLYLPGFFFWWERHRRPLSVGFLQPESVFRISPLCSSNISVLLKDFSTGICIVAHNTKAVYDGISLFDCHFARSKSFSSHLCLTAPWPSHWVPCLSFQSLLLMIQFQ